MKEEEKPPLRVVTHEMVSVTERRRMPRGITERANYKNRPDYVTRRSWHQQKDVAAQRHPKFKFTVPDWLLPKNGVDVWHTITASIVWGICGQMADVPDGGET